MIVYIVIENKIKGVEYKPDDYVLRKDFKNVLCKDKDGNDVLNIINEYSSDVEYQKPLFDGLNVIETVTQQEIDQKNEFKTKQDKIQSFVQDDSTVCVVKTPDGTKDYAVVLGNDGKLSTIEIK